MKRVLLFNPDNDLALAHGSPYFTPPKTAAGLRAAGALLPLWYGDAGDSVLAYGVNARWLERIQREFGIDIDVFDHTSFDRYVPSPWGWSEAARRTFHLEGFADDVLPSDATLQQYRELSHRRTASEINRKLAEQLDFAIAPAAQEFADTESLKTFVEQHQAVMVKAPWSSSGRGLLDSRHLSIEEMLRRSEGIINRQQSVMAEPAYERRADFAMLYECRDGKCNFVGYSLFSSDTGGNYCGNTLITDEEIVRTLSQYYPTGRLVAVSAALQNALDEVVAPIYSGPLGVDMLIAQLPSGEMLLDATVEINLRMTMGHVAHKFTERYLAPGVKAHFYIQPQSNIPTTFDYQTADGRLVVGRLALTPSEGGFNFVVETDIAVC